MCFLARRRLAVDDPRVWQKALTQAEAEEAMPLLPERVCGMLCRACRAHIKMHFVSSGQNCWCSII